MWWGQTHVWMGPVMWMSLRHVIGGLAHHCRAWGMWCGQGMWWGARSVWECFCRVAGVSCMLYGMKMIFLLVSK